MRRLRNGYNRHGHKKVLARLIFVETILMIKHKAQRKPALIYRQLCANLKVYTLRNPRRSGSRPLFTISAVAIFVLALLANTLPGWAQDGSNLLYNGNFEQAALPPAKVVAMSAFPGIVLPTAGRPSTVSTTTNGHPLSPRVPTAN